MPRRRTQSAIDKELAKGQTHPKTIAPSEELLANRRELSSVLDLDTLKSLTEREKDLLSYKLMGLPNSRVMEMMGMNDKQWRPLYKSDKVQTALKQATMNIKAGLLTAGDVAKACEAEVMTTFYQLTMDKDTPLEYKFKFGSKVLDHRANMAKAMGSMLPRGALPPSEQISIIDLDSDTRTRMVSRLTELDELEDVPLLEEGEDEDGGEDEGDMGDKPDFAVPPISLVHNSDTPVR